MVTVPVGKDLEDTLTLVAYRLASVEALGMALHLRERWGAKPSMQIWFGGTLVVDGNGSAFFNPVLEAGIVHARALLEFLGLAMSKKDGRLVGRSRPREPDDVGIEHFSGPSGPLSLVQPSQATARWPDGAVEAEQALLSIFRTANKGLAHITSSMNASPEETRLVEIASRGVRALIVTYLYTPLSLEVPTSSIKSRVRA